ncbi:MAG: ABC transporter permease [Bacteroidales bacterium]|jgi:ABC-2 type transport system permease protein|nr:ABC transporter permease [Bacteroidales bacterium]
MKQFLSFVKKEFYHIFRDKRTVMILFMMPVMQMLLFGFALTTEVKNTKIAVLDLSKDVLTKKIITELDANQYFTLTEYLNSPAEIEKTLQAGKASLVVVFAENFQQTLLGFQNLTGLSAVQIVADASEPNQVQAFVGYASGIINQCIINNVRVENFQPLQIVPEVKMLYNPQMKGAYNFVPGVMGLILMLICAMMTSISIVREKELGTMEVLLASPMKPMYIILSKVTPYFALSVANLITILLLSVLVLGVPIAGSLTLLTMLSLLFILCSLSLGLLISNLVNTQVAAMLISGMGLMMPTMLLSGMMFPLDSMPKILQVISSIIPARWFIEAVRKVMIQGVDIIYIAKELAILAFMVVFIIFLSLKTFKIRLSHKS